MKISITKWGQFHEQIPDEVHDQMSQAPVTDGSGYIRDNLQLSISLLEEAGSGQPPLMGPGHKTWKEIDALVSS